MEHINAVPDTEAGVAKSDDVRDFDQPDRPSRVTRKRRRAALSCTECRRRKRKCDGKHPCCDCKLRNKANGCHYADSPVDIKHVQEIMSPRGQTTASAYSPSSATDAISKRLDNTATLSISELGYARTGNSTADFLDRFHAGRDELMGGPGASGWVNDNFLLWRDYKRLLEKLPARACTEKLVDFYFREINWQYYALDEGTFKQQLQTWYQLDLSAAFNSLSPDWRAFPAMLFELVATAVLLMAPEAALASLELSDSDIVSFETMVVEYNKSATEIIRLLGKRQISLTTVIAGFLQVAFLKYFGQVTEAWHALGEVIKDAQEIGLHSTQRDPKPRSNDAAAVLENQWNIQDRRRIWMILSGWDIHTAMVLGRPAAIIDTLEPTLPIDAIIVQNRLTNPVLPRGAHDAPTPLTRAIWAYRIMSNLRKVQALEREGPFSEDFSHVDRLDQEMRQLDADIPCFFHRYNPDRTFDSIPDCYWIPRARATLPQLLSFNLIALHRPYIFTHPASRSRALGACLDMLRAQKEHFESIQENQYKTFFLFFGTFDAVVLMASIYTFFPEDHPDKILQAVQHLQWSIDRFEAMSNRNVLAKAAVDTLRTFLERLKLAFVGARFQPSLDAALLDTGGSSMQAIPLPIDMSTSISNTDTISRSSSIGLSPLMPIKAPELLERLARCEALLKQYESAPPPNGSGTSTSQSTPYDHATGNTEASQSASDSEGESFDLKVSTTSKPIGSFIDEGGNAKYVDSFPWATIQGQLKSIRQILEDEEGSPSEADSSMPPQLEKNLLDDITLIDLETVTPSPAQIFWLWNIFLERVNPLTKLIHVPSMQQFVVEASGRHSSVPMNSQALLFSIYLISTVTLTESESLEMLHMTRDDALHKFTLGTKAALYRAKFLETFDTTILKALVLFLESRHGRTSRHTTWILSGVMVRMALKLGLHRDGSSLDITPFEAEMRRRLWWRIMISETKYSLASGYGEPVKIKECDTQLPHNVNDADLYPSFMEPVQSREAPTEMALCLLLYHFCQFAIETRITDLHTLSHGFGAERSQARDHALTTYKDMVQNLNAQLLASNYIDPSVSGVHLLADKFRCCIIGDLMAIMVPMHDLPEWGTEIFSAEDNLFRICLTHFEHHFDMYEQIKDTNFLWFPKVQFESDAMLYIASQLQNRAQGSLVDRSWKLLECAYRWHTELWDMSVKDNVTLGLAILRAWRQREKNIGTSGLCSDVPSIIPKLHAVVPQTNPSPIPPVSTLPQPQHTLPSSSQAAYLDTAWIVDQLSSYQLEGSAFDLDQLQWHQH